MLLAERNNTDIFKLGNFGPDRFSFHYNVHAIGRCRGQSELLAQSQLGYQDYVNVEAFCHVERVKQFRSTYL
jgi:hypothetical protein